MVANQMMQAQQQQPTIQGTSKATLARSMGAVRKSMR